MVARRKEERRPVSRTFHLVPGGPRGWHLNTTSRQMETNNWRLERKTMMTQGGREGDKVCAAVLQSTTVYHLN